MKYRKKPVVIEAFQLNSRGLVGEDWFWDAVSESTIIPYFFGKFHTEDAYCDIKTLEGTMRANTGDYIIRGINGEIYPCKPDIFEKTYELVEREDYDFKIIFNSRSESFSAFEPFKNLMTCETVMQSLKLLNETEPVALSDIFRHLGFPLYSNKLLYSFRYVALPKKLEYSVCQGVNDMIDISVNGFCKISD